MFDRLILNHSDPTNCSVKGRPKFGNYLSDEGFDDYSQPAGRVRRTKARVSPESLYANRTRVIF